MSSKNSMKQKYKIEFVDDINIDMDLCYGLLENGKLIKSSKLSKSEQIDRNRRKNKKNFERVRKDYEDR